MVKVNTDTDRRAAIGDAAIGIVAREGLRSLTHRAIDRELALPGGSTSYYFRTRRQLIEAMVHRLAGRTGADLRGEPAPAPGPGQAADPSEAPDPVEAAAATLAALLDRLAARPADHRARYALAVDLVGEPDLHAYLTHASPLRAGFLDAAARTLEQLGVTRPRAYAAGLVALVDGLLFDRVAGAGVDPGARPDAAATIGAYLRGLPAERRRSPG